MINRVRLSPCWWKTVVRTSQTVPHNRSLVRSDGMFHSDCGSVHVVSYSDVVETLAAWLRTGSKASTLGAGATLYI